MSLFSQPTRTSSAKPSQEVAPKYANHYAAKQPNQQLIQQMKANEVKHKQLMMENIKRTKEKEKLLKQEEQKKKNQEKEIVEKKRKDKG